MDNIDENPFFVNPSPIVGIDSISTYLDWSLTSYSPCIDAGVPSGWIVPDLDMAINELLNYNPIGDSYDIGAFEYGLNHVSNSNKLAKRESLSIRNHPNPFNPTTTISYSLPSSGDVKLSIYNIKGQLIEQLLNENQSAGNHSVVWNGANSKGESVGSGVYFYKLITGDETITGKMLMLK